MEVEVKLYAYLKEYAPGDSHIFKLDLAHPSTVKQVVQKLGIPSTLGRLTLVNGRHAQDDTELASGDTVVFLTPLEGG